MVEVENIITKIENAFKDVKLGGGISLREARVIDDRGGKKKRYEARKKDERINWENISYKDIEKYPHIITFLDTEGFLFHLPAYMIFTLKYHNEEKSTNAEEDLIFALTPSNNDRGLFYDQIKLINNAQKETIILFLNWKLIHDNEKYYLSEIQQALEFWNNA